MKKVEQYLRTYIDDDAEITECNETVIEKLPMVFRHQFSFYELRIMEKTVLVIRPDEKHTIHRLQNWMQQIEEKCGMNTVLLLDEASPYVVKKMLMERIAFIIPGRQVSLPFLIMMIRTEKKVEHRSIRKFSPATQMIFLFVLYCKERFFTMEGVAASLDISVMTAQRGLSELETLGLLSYEIQGKTGRKKVFERIEQKEFYEEGKKYLDNPVRNTVYVMQMPEIPEAVVGGLSALSEQSMLGEPYQKQYALYNRYRDQLDGHLVTEEQAAEENFPMVQLMKYDVNKLRKGKYIDPVSLIYSLTEDDERIQMSIDEVMEEYCWYTGEKEEW